MRISRAIALGTLTVGTLDLLDAFIFFGIRNGTPPVRILHSIAAGWLGRASYQGGAGSAALGFATHYFIAFGIVLVYMLLSRRLPTLTTHPLVCGAIYGVGVYFFMNLVVIPLSAIGPGRFVLGPLVNGLLIHILGIGIPSALFAAAVREPSLSRAPARV